MPARQRAVSSRSKRYTVLWVDDDHGFLDVYGTRLSDSGLRVIHAQTTSEALNILGSQPTIKCALVDLLLPGRLQSVAEPGLQLARTIRNRLPKVSLVGLSMLSEGEGVRWFNHTGDGFFCKMELRETWPRLVRRVVGLATGKAARPRVFIVHGHDEVRLRDLKRFLVSQMRLPAPVVLSELASRNRTLIQKFEDESHDIDIAIILATPDDAVLNPKSGRSRSARPNVIFELGYFMKALKSTAGKVILLTVKGTSLPSDVAGVVYIDSTDGPKAYGKELAREIRA